MRGSSTGASACSPTSGNNTPGRRVTPAAAALCVFVTRTFFRGSEGSGIPQVIAVLHSPTTEAGSHLLTMRILLSKIAVSLVAILGGFTIGRE